MGDTTVVCGIKAEIAEPDMARPDEGFLGKITQLTNYLPLPSWGSRSAKQADVRRVSVPNIDLPALCSPKFKPGPPSDEAQTLSNWLNDLLVSYVPRLRTSPLTDTLILFQFPHIAP